MKPRRLPCPLTEEDSRIWTRCARYAYNGSFFLSRLQDRRDAYLMLVLMLEEHRKRYCNLRRIALFMGGTTIDWPEWRYGELP